MCSYFYRRSLWGSTWGYTGTAGVALQALHLVGLEDYLGHTWWSWERCFWYQYQTQDLVYAGYVISHPNDLLCLGDLYFSMWGMVAFNWLLIMGPACFSPNGPCQSCSHPRFCVFFLPLALLSLQTDVCPFLLSQKHWGNCSAFLLTIKGGSWVYPVTKISAENFWKLCNMNCFLGGELAGRALLGIFPVSHPQALISYSHLFSSSLLIKQATVSVCFTACVVKAPNLWENIGWVPFFFIVAGSSLAIQWSVCL